MATRWTRMVERQPIDVTATDFRVLAGDMGMSPDRSKVYVTGYDSVTGNYAIGWIDTASNTFDDYIPIVDNFPPVQLLIDPVSGDYAYTIKATAAVAPVRNAVYKIDLADGSTVATAFPVGALPYRFEITPDGAYLVYGASRDAAGGVSANIWKIRTSDMAIIATITGAGAGPDLNGECAWTSDSATAVAAGRDAEVFILDMASFTVGSPIALPTGYGDPFQCVMSADDSVCWVAMQHTSSLYDVAVPLDMSGLTWGTPVDLNASTTAEGVNEVGPLRMVLSTDESAFLLAHVDDYWRAVDIATDATLKDLSLAEAVAASIGWHGMARISDTKFYILSDTSPDYVLWVERPPFIPQFYRRR